MPNAEVKIRVVGSKEAMKILRGIRDEGRKSSRESKQRARDETRTEETEVRKRERARKSARRREMTEEERRAHEKKLIERDITREHEQQLRARARAEREYKRRGGLAGAAFRGAARLVGGAAAVGNAALGRAERMQGALGISSQESRLQSFMEMQQSFIVLRNQGGLSRERGDELWSQIGETARATNVDPADILASLNTAQNRFSNLEGFAQNMEQIAQVAAATRAPMDDWVGAIGEFQRQLGVSDAEVPALIGSMVGAAQAGSIEAGDIAANFSGLLSGFSQLRGGIQGEGASREFMGMAELIGASGRGAEGTRTLMENLLTALSKSDIQRGVERTLGDRNIFDQRGNLTIGFDELFSRMSSAQGDKFRSSASLEQMGFRDAQARQALAVVMGQYRGGGNPMEDLMNVSAENGNQVIATTMSDLLDSASGRARAVDINARVETMRNGEEVVDAMTGIVAPLTDLQARFPLASEALGFLKDAAMQAGIAMAGMSFLGLGGGAASAAAASAPGIGAGTTAAGIGAAPLALAVGGGVLAAAAGAELANGLSNAASPEEIRRIRESQGSEAAQTRVRSDFGFMQQGAFGQGMNAFAPGIARAIEVMLSPDSRQALASDVARATGEQGARGTGGPARRGGS